MITLLTGLPILIYVVYNLFHLRLFTAKLHCAEMEFTIDALIILYMVIWLLIHAFIFFHFIALAPIIIGFLLSFDDKSEYKRKRSSFIFLSSLLISIIIVIFNALF